MKEIKNKEPRRIKILGFHKQDACYARRELYIGRTGIFTPEGQCVPGYFRGSITCDDGREEMCSYFHAVRYKRIQRTPINKLNTGKESKMNKIKNMWQAFHAMSKKFPKGHLSVRSGLSRYDNGNLGIECERTAYTDNHGGIWASGKTWDEAFDNLARYIVPEFSNE